MIKGKNISLAAVLILFFACPFLVAATSPMPQLEITYPSLPPFANNPPTTSVGPTVLSNYIVYVFGFVIAISSIMAVIIIAIGGTEYIYSAGSPEKTRDAKSKITAAILGLIILAGSTLLLNTINPDIKNIGDPEVAFLIPDIGIGVWGCTTRIDVVSLWDKWKSLKARFNSESKNSAFKTETEEYRNALQSFQAKCQHFNTDSSVSDLEVSVQSASGTVREKVFKNKISFVYLIPEDGIRTFGAVIYSEGEDKKARVVYGDGITDDLPLNKPVEWPVDPKKTARLRPFVLINNPSTDWYAYLYQMPHKNRGADDAPKVKCTTNGRTEDWCDLSSLKPSPPTTVSPGASPSPGTSPSPDQTNNLAAQQDKPPKISSIEFYGSHFIVFFKDAIDEWSTDAELNVIGPSDENNLSSGKYVMSEWNTECKEFRAEEPLSESFYPCAKKAILVSAEFL